MLFQSFAYWLPIRFHSCNYINEMNNLPATFRILSASHSCYARRAAPSAYWLESRDDDAAIPAAGIQAKRVRRSVRCIPRPTNI